MAHNANLEEIMVNKVFRLGVIVLTMILGIMAVGCDNGNNGDNRSIWRDSEGFFELVIDNDRFELRDADSIGMKGIITISGNNITFHITHFYISIEYAFTEFGIAPGWYSRNELITALHNSPKISRVSVPDQYTVRAYFSDNHSSSFSFEPATGIISGNMMLIEGGMILYRTS
jgi:hypothetical protein